MPYAYRIRGPYATAISKIVLDLGHHIVDLSEQLAQRLSLPPRREEVPHATIKASEEDPDTLVIVGMSRAVKELFEILIKRIPYTSHEYNGFGPYTSLVVKVRGPKNDQCVADYGDTTILIQDYRGCVEGETAIVHIVKPATSSNRVAIAFPGVSIIKDTLVLLDDGMSKVFFSEHIKNMERKSALLSLSSYVVRQGYSIRWRSSAKSATFEKIAKDLEEALNEIEKVRLKMYSIDDVITEGEAIAFINLSRPSKEYLDSVRNTVVPTALGHHSMRTCSKLSEFTEIFDMVSKYVDKEMLYRALRYAVIDNAIGKMFRIVHKKPNGEKIEIGSIEVIDVADSIVGRLIVGKRIIKSNGIYDGLGVPKERGDIAITLIPIDTWFIIHRYVSQSGEEKGTYVNINTPPEICLEDKVVKYIDLYIDIVYDGRRVRVVDRDEFKKAIDKKILSPDFSIMVEKTVNYVENNINDIVTLARNMVVKSLDTNPRSVKH